MKFSHSPSPTTIERFDATGAKVWRSTNFALTRAIDTFNFIYEKVQTAKDLCIVGTIKHYYMFVNRFHQLSTF